MKPILSFIFSAFMTLPVIAESVYVKYRGSVDLNGFECSNTSSSFVHRICYQKQSKYLIVRLNNTYYHYCRLPQGTYNSWLSASSKGRYYNRNIKGNYDCRKGGIPNS